MKSSIWGIWTQHLSELQESEDENTFSCDPQGQAAQKAVSYSSLFSTSPVVYVLIFLILLLFRRTSVFCSLHETE